MDCHPARVFDAGVVDLSVPNGVLRDLRVGLGHLYEAVRNLPDRVLHARRHRSVRARLAHVPRPRAILVVCYGNVCRSPYLEAVLKRALPDVQILSAGFVGPGRQVPEFSLAVSAQRGFDLSAFRSRRLEPTVARQVDLVVVMDERQARHLALYVRVPPQRIVIAGDLDPRPSPTRTIQDPWQRPIDAFISSFDRLDRCGATLARSIPPAAWGIPRAVSTRPNLSERMI